MFRFALRLFAVLLLALLIVPLALPAAAQVETPDATPQIEEVTPVPSEEEPVVVVESPASNSLMTHLLAALGGFFGGVIAFGGIAHVILKSPPLMKLIEGAVQGVPSEFADKAMRAAQGLRMGADFIEETFDGIPFDEKESADFSTTHVQGVTGRRGAVG